MTPERDTGHSLPDPSQESAQLPRDQSGTPQTWWYLSFCDPDLAPPLEEQRPGGPSWLGACYVPGASEAEAVIAAHALGCNPGAEVGIYGPLTAEMMDENVPEDQRCRLLTHDDLDPAE